MEQLSPAERFRIALDLYEVGEQMYRQTLKRRHPEWDDAQLDAGIRAWLRHRPGAEFGDFPGPASDRLL